MSAVKAWIFGRVPVLMFALTVLAWIIYLAYSAAIRSPYPTYPDIGGILAIVCYTILGGVLGFLLSAYGLRSAAVPRQWAWAGLILNAPVVLYLVGYYPAVFLYRLFSTR